jgi:hypothetical protein
MKKMDGRPAWAASRRILLRPRATGEFHHKGDEGDEELRPVLLFVVKISKTSGRSYRPMSMNPRRLIIILLLIASAASAQQRRASRPGTGNPDEQIVPWKFLDKGAELVKAPLVVYWIPSTTKDIEYTPLYTSNVLLEASVRCVGFEIVDPGDALNIAKLGATNKLPFAAIVGDNGQVLRQTSARHPKDVEQMVSAELSAREDAAFKDLEKKTVDAYKKVWDTRCLYPLLGREAQRGLKTLGVTVEEPPSTLMPDPNLKVIGKPEKKKP